MATAVSTQEHFDTIIVGAGISGLYQLYKLKELGLKARVYEAGSNVGGVWYWNRYPGARCDSVGYTYQYWFSDELLAEWNWSERFPAQPETERYLNRVADKFDLRKDIVFNTRIEGAHFDETKGVWTVTTATGEKATAQFLVMATGFDAATGALTRLDLRGREGRLLKDVWSKGIHTWLGMTVHGFPNMFMTMAPMSPAAAFCNVPTCSQQQVDWITDCIKYVRDQGKQTIEPTADADDGWVRHHNEVANQTLVPKTKSWYTGANVEGKQQSLIAYIGGVGTYRTLCNEAKESHYKECVLA